MANDEANTFFTFVHTGDFIPFVADYWSANNHLVNSALTWISYKVFGVHEWALRLPNLLSLLVYFIAIYKLGVRLEKTWLRWLFWIPLLTAHFMLEFFAYSRGYGISIAFFLMSIHYLLLSQEKSMARYKHLLLSLGCIVIALYANLNLMVSFMIWWGFAQIPQLKNFDLKKWLGFNFIAAIPFGLAVDISLILKSKEELYIGQSTLHKTFHTLLGRFSDIHDQVYLNVFLVFLGLVFLVGVTLSFKQLQKQLVLNPLTLFLLFFGLNLLAVQLMFWWLDVLMPTERTAMHWFPLFIGLLAFCLNSLKKNFQWVAGVVSLIFILPISLFGLQVANFRVSADPVWALEQIPDSFYLKVQEENKAREFPASISASTSFYTFNWAFKNLKYGGHEPACVDFKFWDPQYVADYLILDLKEYPSFTTLYDTVIHDEPTKVTLLKRKQFLRKVAIDKGQTTTRTENQDHWTMLAEWNLKDSLWQKSIRLDYSLLLLSDEKPLTGLITLELRDSAENTLHYNQFRVNYFKTKFDNVIPIRSSLMLDSVPINTHSVRTLFWNINSSVFTLNSSRVELYELVEN